MADLEAPWEKSKAKSYDLSSYNNMLRETKSQWHGLSGNNSILSTKQFARNKAFILVILWVSEKLAFQSFVNLCTIES